MKLARLAGFAAVAVSIFLLDQPTAMASARLSLLGGYNTSTLYGYDTRQEKWGGGLAGGTSMDLKLGSISIEVGAFFSQTSFSYSSKTGHIGEDHSYKSNIAIFPALGRFWLNDVLAIGAGPYYAIYVGDLTERRVVKNFDDHQSVEHDERLYMDNETRGPYGDYNRKKFEYGGIVSLLLAVEMKQASKDLIGLLDIRYRRALSDGTADLTKNRSSHAAQWQFFAGLGIKL